MSAFKQMPHRRRIRVRLGILFAIVVLTGVGLTFLKNQGQEGSMVYLYIFVAFVIGGVVLAVTGRPIRCPDCGKFLRDGADHPKAQETYLYYCKHCDVIWDTTIGRSSV